MAIDRKYLQDHFASLSDEALAAIDRAELVEAARTIYDEERARRGVAPQRKAVRMPEPAAMPKAPKQAEVPRDLDPEPETETEPAYESAGWSDAETAPDWIEDAACACSFVDYPGTHLSPDAVHARDVLRAAGLPCYTSVVEIPAETRSARPQVEYRVLVPASLNLKALSILDKEIFNARMEADWKAHFEQVTDEELLELSPDVICAGLTDRIERLTKAYEEEFARRRLG